MSKKLFTMIHGDKVHLASQKKIVAASEFSTLMQAMELVEQAKVDAKKYHQTVAEECELIKENAFKKGYEEGLKQWSEQLVILEEAIAGANKQLEQMVFPVALKAAKKIVGKEIELAPDAIISIITANIRPVAQHKKIVIFVNKEDWKRVEQHKSQIKELFEDLQSLSIRPRDDIEPSSCVIETEVGIINAQMTHRWSILEKAFEKLLQSAPQPSTNGQ